MIRLLAFGLTFFLLNIGFSQTKKNVTHEFFLSAGYNYCTKNYIDFGMRYYRWKNDAQTVLSFSGISAGTEISLFDNERTYIPYIGWQGQNMLFAYGVRAEYGITNNFKSIGMSAEVGISLFELIRLTVGYRIMLKNIQENQFNGFRFSIVAAFPLSLLKKN